MDIRRRWFLALAGAWLITVAGASGQDATQNGSAYHAFIGARVLDGTGAPLVNATVIVRDGKVTAIGPAASVTPPRGARITNVAGKVIVPGWISAHAHVSEVDGLRPRAYTEANTARQLGVFARYGITTVWSLGGEQAPAFAAREGQATPALTRARIFVSGDVITGATPDAARQAVTRVAALRPDIIKIRVDDNLGAGTKMAPEVYRAVIDEAHRRGLRVAAHIFYLDDAKDLLRAGVDMIAHSVRDRDIDDEFITLMRARDIPYCPTLTRELATFVYESTPAFFADPFFTREADKDVVARLLQPERQDAMRTSKTAQQYKAGLEVAKRNLKKASDAGLLVVMGTDSGAFPERFEGFFEHLEMEMMVEAGLTPAAVLRSATIDAARAMKVEGIGTLAVGRWADFVVLDRSPLDDIRNTRSIASVWIAGNSVKR
jgi:imidazolonepropionase-like amidohydrolase